MEKIFIKAANKINEMSTQGWNVAECCWIRYRDGSDVRASENFYLFNWLDEWGLVTCNPSGLAVLT